MKIEDVSSIQSTNLLGYEFIQVIQFNNKYYSIFTDNTIINNEKRIYIKETNFIDDKISLSEIDDETYNQIVNKIKKI